MRKSRLRWGGPKAKWHAIYLMLDELDSRCLEGVWAIWHLQFANQKEKHEVSKRSFQVRYLAVKADVESREMGTAKARAGGRIE